MLLKVIMLAEVLVCVSFICTHLVLQHQNLLAYIQESWNPMWTVASILTGLLSFMLESQITTGSLETTVSPISGKIQLNGVCFISTPVQSDCSLVRTLLPNKCKGCFVVVSANCAVVPVLNLCLWNCQGRLPCRWSMFSQ